MKIALLAKNKIGIADGSCLKENQDVALSSIMGEMQCNCFILDIKFSIQRIVLRESIQPMLEWFGRISRKGMEKLMDQEFFNYTQRLVV